MASRLATLFFLHKLRRQLPLRSRLEITSVSSSAVAKKIRTLCIIEYIGSWCSSGTGLVPKRKVKTENSQLRHKHCFSYKVELRCLQGKPNFVQKIFSLWVNILPALYLRGARDACPTRVYLHNWDAPGDTASAQSHRPDVQRQKISSRAAPLWSLKI